jgi:predicted xylose isomerase-like sugar epimerase
MQFMDRDEQRGLWYEELNRARQEIQNKWTEAERSHRRQLAECRQQALARALLLLPMNKSRARQLA